MEYDTFYFSALTLFVRRQEGHLACIKLGVGLLVVTIWQFCTSYCYICHNHHRHTCCNEIQNDDILIPTYPHCPGKWQLNGCFLHHGGCHLFLWQLLLIYTSFNNSFTVKFSSGMNCDVGWNIVSHVLTYVKIECSTELYKYSSILTRSVCWMPGCFCLIRIIWSTWSIR